MATLILHKNSQGETIGRCDAKCYNAKGLKCRCVCVGINHGVGYNQAIDNTRNDFDWVKYDIPGDKIIITPNQLNLFEGCKP